MNTNFGEEKNMKNNVKKMCGNKAFVLWLITVLAGCTSLTPEKRHSPAELASYKIENFVAPITSAAGEQAVRMEALEKISAAMAASVVSTVSATNLNPAVPEALGAVAHFNTEYEVGRNLVLVALSEFERNIAAPTTEYQRAVIAAAFALYPQESAPSLKRLLEQLVSPREFAMAAYTVLKAGYATRDELRGTLVRRFPDWGNEPRLNALEHALTTDSQTELAQRPPLVDLLVAPLHRQGLSLPVIYSFQRKNRQRFGLAMVRNPDGQFLRNADGSYFNIPQLAMALTNLPGTITNGNTPQGLFTIVGAGTATNKWIGPTPYLHSKVPVEASVAEYEHTELTSLVQAPEAWTMARYEHFLPASWRGYYPFKEAFLAGMAGRDDMLMHGTTVNSNYYRGATFYPGTPSAGCLVAMEYWSQSDGSLLRSDQLSLAKAFTASGIDQGYLLVIELDDRPLAVSLADVMPDVMAAEALTRDRQRQLNSNAR